MPGGPSAGDCVVGGRPTDGGASGRLVVCPTPIGNLEDVTLRVLATLRAADMVACEDTRHTKVLLDRHGITAKLVSYHEHNERERAEELVARMGAGAVVALVSDAGMPLISDPGFPLVRACVEAGLPVEVLPGPSAALTALVASGLPAERWRFVGFLPRKRAELERLLEHTEETLVAFESPRRLAATLAQLAERDPDRFAGGMPRADEAARGSPPREQPQSWRSTTRENAPRGEVVLVVGAAGSGSNDPAGRADALAALRALVEAGARPRPAATVVSKLTALPPTSSTGS